VSPSSRSIDSAKAAERPEQAKRAKPAERRPVGCGCGCLVDMLVRDAVVSG
jgi:hypothetical protein